MIALLKYHMDDYYKLQIFIVTINRLASENETEQNPKSNIKILSLFLGFLYPACRVHSDEEYTVTLE